MSHRKRRAAAGSRSVICFAVAGLAGASPLLAADAVDPPAPEEIQAMAEVTVTATRTERRLDEVPASVSVISARDIESQRVVKVEDALRNVEGVDVKSSASGDAAMVSLRGLGGSFAGTTTQVLVDGMPIEPVVPAPKGAALDFSDLGEIERIEVVRGPAAALYGPSAMGGVINILTRRGTPGLGGELEVGAGSHDARLLRGAVRGGTETVDFRIYAGEYQTDGYIARPRPGFWGDQDLAGRDWRQKKFGLSVGVHPTEDQEITFGVRHYNTDMAWYGGRPNYRVEREGTYYNLGYRLQLGAVGDIRFKYLSSTVQDTLGGDGLVYGDPSDFNPSRISRRKESGEMFEIQANLKIGSANLLTVGVSESRGKQVETEKLDIPVFDIYELSGVREQSRVLGIFAQDEITLSESTRLLIGGRYDRFRLFGNDSYFRDNYGTDEVRTDPDSAEGVFNPRVGVRHKLAEGTSVYASYGTAYLPALNLLRHRANSNCSNPDLKPERSTSYEVGVNQEWNGVSLRAAAFHSDYRDKIETHSLVDCSLKYVNVGSVSVDGLELGVEGRFASAWRPYANYSFNDAKITDNPANPASEGKRLNWTPRHKFNVGVLYAPSRDLTARLSGRYVGDRYFDGTMQNSPDARAPGYFVADFKISRRIELGTLARSAELSFAVNNLLDRNYVDQKSYEKVFGSGVEIYRDYADRRNFWVGLKTLF